MSMSHERKYISVIIPAYLAERTIENDIRRIDSSLSQLGKPYEIIVVVDGSPDRTKEYADKTSSSRIQIIGYTTNRGKGYAVRYGMARATSNIIAFIDSGSDISLEGFSMFLEHFLWYKADIVVGSKRHPDSKVIYPWQRKILSWGYQILIKIFFGLTVRDTQVGMKLYRRSVLEDVLPRLLVKRFAFDIEILAVAYHLGYTRIFEAPVILDFSQYSTITSINLWKALWNVLWDTLAVFYRLKILHYYDNSNKRRWRYDPELNFRINIG